MISRFRFAVPFVLATLSLGPANAADTYSYGHVWRLSFVRTEAGQSRAYLQNLDANYKKVLEEAKRRGVIVSYKVLQAAPWAATKDDWSVILMLELPNLAAADGFDEKMDEVTDKVIGEKADKQGDITRAKIREYLGIKFAQEVILK